MCTAFKSYYYYYCGQIAKMCVRGACMALPLLLGTVLRRKLQNSPPLAVQCTKLGAMFSKVWLGSTAEYDSDWNFFSFAKMMLPLLDSIIILLRTAHQDGTKRNPSGRQKRKGKVFFVVVQKLCLAPGLSNNVNQ